MKNILIIVLSGFALCGCSKKETAKHYPKDTLVFSGYASPDSACESFTWAVSKGDKAVILQSMAPAARDGFEKHLAGKTDAQIKEEITKGMGFPGYTVQKREIISDDEVILDIMVDGADQIQKMDLKKIGSEWKLDDPKS